MSSQSIELALAAVVILMLIAGGIGIRQAILRERAPKPRPASPTPLRAREFSPAPPAEMVDPIRLAREAFKAGDYETTAVYAASALMRDPTSVEGLRWSAVSAERLGFRDLAADSYLKLAAGRDNTELRLALRNYRALNNWQAVVSACDTVASPSPSLLEERRKAAAHLTKGS